MSIHRRTAQAQEASGSQPQQRITSNVSDGSGNGIKTLIRDAIDEASAFNKEIGWVAEVVGDADDCPCDRASG